MRNNHFTAKSGAFFAGGPPTASGAVTTDHAGPTSGPEGTTPSSHSAVRDVTGSRIPMLRNRGLLHVQFDGTDLESSKGSTTTLEGTKTNTMLETDSGYLTTMGSLGQKDRYEEIL